MVHKNKIYKGFLDLLIIIAMIGCWASTDSVKGHRGQFRSEQDIINDFSWGTWHSMLSIMFSLLMLIHIIQHWKLIKSIVTKSLYSKNIVSTITMAAFLITIISYLIFLTGFSHAKGEFHGTVANFFLIICCAHLVLNLKKLFMLFGGRLIREGSALHTYLLRDSGPKVIAALVTVFRRK